MGESHKVPDFFKRSFSPLRRVAKRAAEVKWPVSCTARGFVFFSLFFQAILISRRWVSRTEPGPATTALTKRGEIENGTFENFNSNGDSAAGFGSRATTEG